MKKTPKLYALTSEIYFSLQTPMVKTTRGLTKRALKSEISKLTTHFAETGIKFTITQDWK